MITVGHYIDGKRVEDRERLLDVFNPATGQVIKQVALAGQATVTRAVDAAVRAYPHWRGNPVSQRTRVISRFRALLERHAETIIEAITEEHGKVVNDARGEFQRGLEAVEYACGVAELLKGEYSRGVGTEIDSWSDFQPLGVVAGIAPFNFPVMVPMWMYPMAIACGNAFVLKPSEQDPGPSMLIAELFREAGLPDGVFNVINGDKIAVDALLADPRIQAVSSVSSTPVAEYIHRTASACGKRVQALGGAKNHAVVMSDADLDNAVDAIMGAAFGSCGERCMAISVVVAVGEQTADDLVDKIAQQVSRLKVGPASCASSDMGPLISRRHLQKVEDCIAGGVEEGARLVVDGRGLTVAGCEQGYFLGGSLFDRVEAHMEIYREEIFGPVLCLVRVSDLNEAMELIDSHQYGNGACLFTRDGQAARYFENNVLAGMVGINVPLPVPAAYHSFGGCKRSLFGDLGAYGPDAVRFYTRRKTITQRWPSANVREGVKFSFPV